MLELYGFHDSIVHITDVVFLEHGPFVRSVERVVSCALPIGFGRSAGLAKIFDEVFSF